MIAASMESALAGRTTFHPSGLRAVKARVKVSDLKRHPCAVRTKRSL